MKNLLPRLVKAYDRIVVVFLGFMGLATQCMPVAEYGTPHADYHFRGNITGKADQQAIENIQVRVYENDTLLLGECRTDATGAYAMDLELFPFDYTFKIHAEDTDGADNGSYIQKDSTVVADLSGLNGGGDNWYSGEMEIRTDLRLDEFTE